MTFFKLKDSLNGESSRSAAVEVREKIISSLKHAKGVEIDLEGADFTPSVADEIIGVLAIMLGAESFKNKIKILNATESQMALMKHVIARRLSALSNFK